MSAGGHCHGDPMLPLQPDSCPGLLYSGNVHDWIRWVKSSLVLHVVQQTNAALGSGFFLFQDLFSTCCLLFPLESEISNDVTSKITIFGLALA